MLHHYRGTWQISMIMNIGHTIVYALHGQDFFFYSNLRLGCPVMSYILQLHFQIKLMYFNKADKINAVNYFFSQSSVNISFSNAFNRQILLDTCGH